MKCYILILSLIMSLILSSCINGEDGPSGPKGEDGRNGYNGINGINGSDGKDGLTTILNQNDSITNYLFKKFSKMYVGTAKTGVYMVGRYDTSIAVVDTFYLNLTVSGLYTAGKFSSTEIGNYSYSFSNKRIYLNLFPDKNQFFEIKFRIYTLREVTKDEEIFNSTKMGIVLKSFELDYLKFPYLETNNTKIPDSSLHTDSIIFYEY